MEDKVSKKVVRYLIQSSIFAAIGLYVFFIFSGASLPKWQDLFVQQPEEGVIADFHTRPSGSQNTTIRYSGKQIKKMSKAIKMTGISSLYVPRKGIQDDYLKKIKIETKKKRVRLIYSNYDIVQSAHKITPRSKIKEIDESDTGNKKKQWLNYEDGSFDLLLEIKGTYIKIGNAKDASHERLEKISKSLISLSALG